MVANAIAQACSSLESWEDGPALATIEGDHQINSLEVDIDETCLTLIALYQPAATDLRFITTAMKIVTTLERIGDLAGNISHYALDLIAAVEERIDLTSQLDMAVRAQELLNKSLRAFIDWDAELALHMARSDKAIDKLYQDTLWNAVERMQGQDLQTMHNIMRTFMISKFLERIGDHAVHICEMVVFMVKGRIIRHQKATLDYLDEEFH
jgi:phosphate transport system protein